MTNEPKTLRLMCSSEVGDYVELRYPDMSTDFDLELTVFVRSAHGRPPKEVERIFLDKASVREAFNFLGVWLHTV